MTDTPLWQPSDTRVSTSNMTAFMEEVENDWNVTIEDVPALYDFSIAETEKFWQSLKDIAPITVNPVACKKQLHYWIVGDNLLCSLRFDARV